MSNRHGYTFLALVTAALLQAPTLKAQPLSHVGTEFQVNTYTTVHQRTPAISARGAGFVVVWQSEHQDGSEYGVFGRRFNSSGLALGAEFLVPQTTANTQTSPAVAVAPDGRFVVVWSSEGSTYQVFGRRFDSAGTAIGSEFQVSSSTSAYSVFLQVRPAVATEPDGDFVAVWEDDTTSDVFGRRFNSAGAPVGQDFRANAYTLGLQGAPRVATDPQGGFAVTWHGAGAGDDGYGVFVRRFNSSGTPIASEFQVNAYTAGTQFTPTIGAADGSFVVAWQSFAQDGSGEGVFGRRLNSGAFPVGAEFQINQATAGQQYQPAVEVDADGGFVVAWTGADGYGYGILARRFDSTGAPRTGEFVVSRYATSNQTTPAIAATADGAMVVVWESFNQDGDDGGVFGQRLTEIAVLDIDANGDVDALTDGLLFVRYLFGVTGTTLTNGVTAANCGRCDSPSIESYLAGLV